jgi:hypothetical protein
MAEFKITRECDSLTRANQSDGLEDHICNGFARYHITSDHLMDDVQRNRLICDSLDHGERDGQDDGEDEAYDDCPDGEFRRENGDCDYEEDGRNDTDNTIPPVRDLRVH